ncbi:MAG: hypothetical protein N2578_01355 [Bdellovibrionaceae bacterium]|nr:hypothetical protein [Pseudobdellovibrionaceae bacterium]
MSEDNLGKAAEKNRHDWAYVHQELTQALASWKELSERLSSSQNPEKAQLEEVKKLLQELQSQIDSLSHP